MCKPFLKCTVPFGTRKDFICHFIKIFFIRIPVFGILCQIIIVPDSPPDIVDCRIRAQTGQMFQIIPQLFDPLRDPRLLLI